MSYALRTVSLPQPVLEKPPLAPVGAPRAEPQRPPLGIAMLTNLFHPVATGSATQVRGLSRALGKAGHRVVVITARIDRDTPEHEVMDGVDVYRVPAIHLPKMAISLNFPWLNWTFWPANLRRIEEILRRHDVELLHVHNHMFDMAFAARVLKRRLGLPVVLTLHTIIKHSINAFNLLLFPADRGLLKHVVVKYADRVIAPDFNMDAYLREAFGRQDGALIPYGIDLPRHPGAEVRRQIVEHFKLDGRRVILSLGHVHALRNRLDLIRALPRVCERIPETLLLIVGAVADQRPVALVKELGLQDHAIFAGPQPHAHVPVYHELAEMEAMWLDQADAGLNSLGIACMEGMYAGNPVLTVSNVDTFGPGVLKSHRDVIILKQGAIDELSATLIDLLSHPDRIEAIGNNARKLALGRFAWSSVVEQTDAVYRSALAESAVGRAEIATA